MLEGWRTREGTRRTAHETGLIPSVCSKTTAGVWGL